LHHIVRVRYIGQKDQEFIAAVPAHGVGLAHGGREALGGEPQHLIAHRVA